MKTKERIKIAEEIAPTVSSRDVIHDLKERILCLDSKEVHLDFEDVECISRSAAHELLLLKKALTWRLFRRKKVVFVNTNESVSKMLKVVAYSRTSRRKRSKALNIQKVDFSSLQYFSTP